jgi:DNA-directed RNA polymerase alpha subunit
MPRQPSLRTCPNGHQYYKSTDCPTCPVCEKEKAPVDHFLSQLAAPARRALEREKITTAAQLSAYSRKDILRLHGIGPSSLPALQSVLQKAGLSFKDEQND